MDKIYQIVQFLWTRKFAIGAGVVSGVVVTGLLFLFWEGRSYYNR